MRTVFPCSPLVRVPSPGRRALLRSGLQGLALLTLGRSLASCSQDNGTPVPSTPPMLLRGRLNEIGPLGDPDPRLYGLRFPQGFSARVVARAGESLGLQGHRWHAFPDGGATFATVGGGWIYVSNSEVPSIPQLGVAGGVGALSFDAEGRLLDAYPLIEGSQINCSGGPTPWASWISCEEWTFGAAWECEPGSPNSGRRLPALGFFTHEAVCVDARSNTIYLTEDIEDGRLYRFVPDRPNVGGRADLSSGRLQVLKVVASSEQLGAISENGPLPVQWLDVPRPNPDVFDTPTRYQQPESTAFSGGEGLWYQDGKVYFSTKGDNRVWALDLDRQTLELAYDDDWYLPCTAAEVCNSGQDSRPLFGVDNLTMTPGHDLVVVEDGGLMRAVAITASGRIVTLIQIEGQDGSEITGPAFSPDGRHFYFSSQRGPSLATHLGQEAGTTYCVSGPWFDPT